MIAEEGKAGRKIGETWSAILVPSPAASNIESTYRVPAQVDVGKTGNNAGVLSRH